MNNIFDDLVSAAQRGWHIYINSKSGNAELHVRKCNFSATVQSFNAVELVELVKLMQARDDMYKSVARPEFTVELHDIGRELVFDNGIKCKLVWIDANKEEPYGLRVNGAGVVSYELRDLRELGARWLPKEPPTVSKGKTISPGL